MNVEKKKVDKKAGRRDRGWKVQKIHPTLSRLKADIEKTNKDWLAFRARVAKDPHQGQFADSKWAETQVRVKRSNNNNNNNNINKEEVNNLTRRRTDQGRVLTFDGTSQEKLTFGRGSDQEAIPQANNLTFRKATSPVQDRLTFRNKARMRLDFSGQSVPKAKVSSNDEIAEILRNKVRKKSLLEGQKENQSVNRKGQTEQQLEEEEGHHYFRKGRERIPQKSEESRIPPHLEQHSNKGRTLTPKSSTSSISDLSSPLGLHYFNRSLASSRSGSELSEAEVQFNDHLIDRLFH